jgi:hypothetical protein
MLRRVAALAPGSSLAMTYLLPLEFADAEERHGYEEAMRGARASGTPLHQFLHIGRNNHARPRGRL